MDNNHDCVTLLFTLLYSYIFHPFIRLAYTLFGIISSSQSQNVIPPILIL